MAAVIKDVLKIVEKLAPQQAAMEWDRVGLQLGSEKGWVERVLVALELTEKVMEEAIEKRVQLILTHHPFLFKGINQIIKEDAKGSLIYQAIQNDIAIYGAHTNIDAVPGGLNDQFAEKLGLQSTEILEVTSTQAYQKLVVFVPPSHVQAVQEALWQAGAGHIGQYSHCSFTTEGVGSFLPLEGAQPYLGEQNLLEKTPEIRLETIIPVEKAAHAVAKMIEAHPYEEVAYDLYPLVQETIRNGIGRVGNLAEPIPLMLYIEQIKTALQSPNVRLIGDPNQVIERVCLVNGSGAEYIAAAAKAGCQLLVTGDVKYHDAQTALELGINVVDAGHFETEAYFTKWMATYLTEYLNKQQLPVEVIPSTTYLNPFQIL